jgi:hypothetical protein
MYLSSFKRKTAKLIINESDDTTYLNATLAESTSAKSSLYAVYASSLVISLHFNT